jgi:hypothetical protein
LKGNNFALIVKVPKGRIQSAYPLKDTPFFTSGKQLLDFYEQAGVETVGEDAVKKKAREYMEASPFVISNHADRQMRDYGFTPFATGGSATLNPSLNTGNMDKEFLINALDTNTSAASATVDFSPSGVLLNSEDDDSNSQ